MTKSDRGTPLTISLQIPTYWTPEQAFAVFELVDELRETIWRCYALQLQQEYRDQRRHHDADYDPIEPTICRSDLQSPSKTQRGLSAPFVAIAPPLRGFTQPLTPDIGTVIADPMHMRDTRKGAIFADDCCCLRFHRLILCCGCRLVRSP